MKKFTKQVILVVLVSFCLFVLESVIKYYLILNKIPREGFYLFFGNLHIGYFINENIAFSFPLPLFMIMTLVIIVLILLSLFWWWSLAMRNIWHVVSLSLVIIGALSNLIDRIVFGYVIDYINIFIWPVFNLADAMIIGGVLVYFISEFIRKKKRKVKK